MRKTFLLSMILIITCGLNIKAQISYTINTQTSNILVTGTSSLHAWEMESKAVSGKMTASIETTTLSKISEANISCSALSLKSESKIMDGKAHDALKADNAPNITFYSTTITDLATNKETFRGTITGDLTIAGKMNKLSIPFTGKVSSSDEISVLATTSFNMSLFGIEPPTAMFGALTTGDKVVLKITLNFLRIK